MIVVFECARDHRDLLVLTHSFPTRRSSDLRQRHLTGTFELRDEIPGRRADDHAVRQRDQDRGLPDRLQPQSQEMRSEEHTSELQSLMRISYAVFCLKKKKTTKKHKIYNNITVMRL